MNFDNNEIDNLINSAFKGGAEEAISNLREKFDNRINELGISSFQAEKNLGIEYKTLNRILDGDIKKYDLIALIKIGSFIGVTEKEMSDVFSSIISKQHHQEIEYAKKTTFILDYFDLPSLKEIGVIKSITDFDQIEKSLNSIFDLNSILDYDLEESGAALSSTTRIGKSLARTKAGINRSYFIDKSKAIFKLINNPNKFQRELLIEYFPKIRRHSIDLETGLISVIRSLYSLGVTVIFQPKIPSVKMRGATFEVNKKPCIVLTDFRQSYPTMWFTLLHELFHVLFDWDEILVKKYHLSEEDSDLLVLQHKEDEANEFAREYLFPKAKVAEISNRISQNYFIRQYAEDHHVHPSVIYANYAFITGDDNKHVWAKFDTFIRPKMESLINKLIGDLSHKSTTKEFSNYYANKIYNEYE